MFTNEHKPTHSIQFINAIIEDLHVLSQNKSMKKKKSINNSNEFLPSDVLL